MSALSNAFPFLKSPVRRLTYLPPPVADFSVDSTTGAYPVELAFTDESTNSPDSWLWDFGDGGTSTLQNPSHTYTIDGTFTVSLAAANGAGSDTETKANYITITIPFPGINGLKAYWNLNEADGAHPINAIDAKNGYNLTDVGSVAANGSYREFGGFSSGQYLTRSSNADLQTGDVQFSVGGWIYPDNFDIVQILISKGDVSTTLREFDIVLFTTTGEVLFRTYYNNGASFYEVSGGLVSLNNWHLIVGSYDASTDSIKVSVDNGSYVTLPNVVNPPVAGNGELYLGAAAHVTYLSVDGRERMWGFWKGLNLSQVEIGRLWNSGNGRTYP